MSEGLPKWLSNPLIISSSAPPSSETDTSDTDLFDALGIEGLFPFQSFVRGRLLARHRDGERDLCVSAPTGSGKTLAYVLPIVEKLRRRVVGRLRALVVVPTRDLIPQVEDTFRVVCEAYNCAAKLKNGLDYMVTTPGKLVSAIGSGEMKDLKYLVVDEADRLLDQSFQEWLPQLLDALKPDNSRDDAFDPPAWTGSQEGQVQKLLFSATLTTNPAKIAPLNLHRPLYVCVRSDSSSGGDGGNLVMDTPETLKELMAVFDGAEELKPAVLIEILETLLPQFLDGPVSRVLCFTKSVSSTQRLSRLLAVMRPDLSLAAFHGNLSDPDRTKILDQFENGSIQILIGSDAMARGLDLKSVKCVVNYDMPMFASTYVHRVGRTARAGQEGLALTILPASQTRSFKNLLKSEQLSKRVVDFGGELRLNEVSKIELDGGMISAKWRDRLVESLKQLRSNK